MANRQNKKGRSKHGPPFVQLRKFMLESDAWLHLSLAARAAYVEIERVYSGSNNGTLGMGVRFLAKRLRCSNDTAARALRELEDVGFVECVKIGGFARKNRKASEYRLTMHRCDLSGHLPSKSFMQWVPPLSDRKDNTVRPQGQSQQNCRSQYDRKDRQRQKPPFHCPTTGTHIESIPQGGGPEIASVHSEASASAARPKAAQASEREPNEPIQISDALRLVQARKAKRSRPAARAVS